eukprot:jgi/Picsp_1/4213/NSC_01722-R1_ankyrin repeat domain protein
MAATNGHTDVVDRLTSRYNANVEATDQDGKTALSRAAENGLTDIVNILATQGNANLDATEH